MTSDKFQKAWQSAAGQTRVTIDADMLLNEVRANQRAFAACIWWRDVREIGVAVILIPVWIYMGVAFRIPWSWYLTIPAIIGVAGFLLIDRLRQRRNQPAAGQPLRQHVEMSLAAVEHQIWLLRNVFWWYILPFVVTVSAFLLHLAWLSRGGVWNTIHMLMFVSGIVIATWTFVFWLNQRAVRTSLEPRREELIALLRGLGEGP